MFRVETSSASQKLEPVLEAEPLSEKEEIELTEDPGKLFDLELFWWTNNHKMFHNVDGPFSNIHRMLIIIAA